ncbi:MAG: MerR family transcriptional regulator [Acidobacteria bacterium]|jgi:MerR family transcriptional regulator, heat shock protein HspR|nr:MerR family transcriptional regulator [Acidobacteriota bacterium]
MTNKPRYRMISWVAETYEVHPQTLRLWEREGLLRPRRSKGNTRLYDEETCRRLETILALTRDLGVNLAGVEIVLNLREQVEKLQQEVEVLTRILREKLEQERGVPRYHALVKVQTGTIQPTDGE